MLHIFDHTGGCSDSIFGSLSFQVIIIMLLSKQEIAKFHEINILLVPKLLDIIPS